VEQRSQFLRGRGQFQCSLGCSFQPLTFAGKQLFPVLNLLKLSTQFRIRAQLGNGFEQIISLFGQRFFVATQLRPAIVQAHIAILGGPDQLPELLVEMTNAVETLHNRSHYLLGGEGTVESD
jgi:hypothetical protein